ncbi:hypothetical protein L9F63_009313, partial [Diploptera punctata]
PFSIDYENVSEAARGDPVQLALAQLLSQGDLTKAITSAVEEQAARIFRGVEEKLRHAGVSPKTGGASGANFKTPKGRSRTHHGGCCGESKDHTAMDEKRITIYIDTGSEYNIATVQCAQQAAEGGMRPTSVVLRGFGGGTILGAEPSVLINTSAKRGRSCVGESSSV